MLICLLEVLFIFTFFSCNFYEKVSFWPKQKLGFENPQHSVKKKSLAICYIRFYIACNNGRWLVLVCKKIVNLLWSSSFFFLSPKCASKKCHFPLCVKKRQVGRSYLHFYAIFGLTKKKPLDNSSTKLVSKIESRTNT